MATTDFEIDNRDTTTTWLKAKCVTIEVDPWALVHNVIENAGMKPEHEDKAMLILGLLKQTVISGSKENS